MDILVVAFSCEQNSKTKATLGITSQCKRCICLMKENHLMKVITKITCLKCSSCRPDILDRAGGDGSLAGIQLRSNNFNPLRLEKQSDGSC